MTIRSIALTSLITTLFLLSPVGFSAEKILDHEVVLDQQGRLQPWTSYDSVIVWSVRFINHCPIVQTKFGQDPYYLVSAKFNEDGQFLKKQNNQASNIYWAMESAKKYYHYSGDASLFRPARDLIDRVLVYRTPADWAWPNVPVTQDDTPDGEYTDEWSEPDKMCMVAIGCLYFFKYSGEKKYLQAALEIGRTIARHTQPGDAEHSPLPFRVHLPTGRILDTYNSNMISVVKMFDLLLPFASPDEQAEWGQKSALLVDWLLRFPLINHYWSGCYEDVVSQKNNLNQQTPMETARYLLQHPELDPEYKTHVPALCAWVENRFGQTKRYGATSIREQDSCFLEMSSHTARYASVVAAWYGISSQEKDFEEARAAFALATYSAHNRYSLPGKAINYVGIGYLDPWFSDSYFDYLSHLLDGLAEIPTMMEHHQNRLLASTAVLQKITYQGRSISYQAFEPDGVECIYLLSRPKILADGKPIAASAWQFGEYRGANNILRIKRSGVRHIQITAD